MRNKSKVISQKSKVWIIIIALLIMPAVLAAGGGYPQQQEKYVNDFAGILTTTDRNTLSEMMKNLENQTGVEMAVVTVKTITDYSTNSPDVESFAAGLFNAWETGKSKGNNGVMMLVSRDDRKMRIVLGEQYVFMYELVMQRVIENKMLPFFKDGYYSRGIYEGAREIIGKLTRKVSFAEFYWKEIAGGAAGIIIILLILTRNIFPPKKRVKSSDEEQAFGGGASGGWG